MRRLECEEEEEGARCRGRQWKKAIVGQIISFKKERSSIWIQSSCSRQVQTLLCQQLKINKILSVQNLLGHIRLAVLQHREDWGRGDVSSRAFHTQYLDQVLVLGTQSAKGKFSAFLLSPSQESAPVDISSEVSSSLVEFEILALSSGWSAVNGKTLCRVTLQTISDFRGFAWGVRMDFNHSLCKTLPWT